MLNQEDILIESLLNGFFVLLGALFAFLSQYLLYWNKRRDARNGCAGLCLNYLRNLRFFYKESNVNEINNIKKDLRQKLDEYIVNTGSNRTHRAISEDIDRLILLINTQQFSLDELENLIIRLDTALR